jgi:Ca-activated chloride channel homolog
MLLAVAASTAARPVSAPPEASPPQPTPESSALNLGPSASSWTIAKAVLPGYTIRHTVPEVRIQFTVADGRGRLLQSLTRSDFHILDNRDAVPQIRDFSRLDDLPLQVGILLDVSDSVQKSAARQRQAALFFVRHVLHPQSDRAALFAFSNEVRQWQATTGDRDALSQALARVQQLGFATYLFDGLYRVCQDQFPQSTDDGFAQRILVLISDGNDTGSLHSLADAIYAAQLREVQIFALSVHPGHVLSIGDSTLARLADATGGQFFLANGEKDFPAIFTAMEQQMRTQYSVSFEPAAPNPGFHAVKIEMEGEASLRVHARQGYFYDAP